MHIPLLYGLKQRLSALDEHLRLSLNKCEFDIETWENALSITADVRTQYAGTRRALIHEIDQTKHKMRTITDERKELRRVLITVGHEISNATYIKYREGERI